jgi:hypothetical protein
MTTIAKIALPRRTFLRGVGATLALPLLDAMVPALTAQSRTAARTVRRMGFVYVPHGSVNWMTGEADKWTPREVGRIGQLTPILSPLAPVKDHLIIPTNLEHKNAQGNGTDGNAEHTRANATWLSATRPKMTEGADVELATTVDQWAARELCKDTRLPSLELSMETSFVVGNCDNGYNCVYMNTMSWASPTNPLPMENHPRAVFERLFGDGGSTAEVRRQTRKDRSILDSVVEDMTRVQKLLGAADRAKVDEYVGAIREVERRIQSAEKHAESSLTLPERPIGIPEQWDDHAKLMIDLQVLAFQADITRVFTFMLGREQNNSHTFPWIGVNEGHHNVSHLPETPEKFEKIVKIDTYHCTLLAYMLEKLHAIKEGDGSLLDHSMVLYGSGMGNGHHHSHFKLPIIVAGGLGGQLKGGRHVVYPEYVPMANLLLGLLDKAGVHLEKIGDSSGRIALDPLSLA